MFPPDALASLVKRHEAVADPDTMGWGGSTPGQCPFLSLPVDSFLHWLKMVTKQLPVYLRDKDNLVISPCVSSSMGPELSRSSTTWQPYHWPQCVLSFSSRNTEREKQRTLSRLLGLILDVLVDIVAYSAFPQSLSQPPPLPLYWQSSQDNLYFSTLFINF